MNKVFYNFPKLTKISDYQNARETIIHEFKKSEDLKAIFEYGSVNNIGISDLDIIVVLDNIVKKNCSSLISKEKLPEKTLNIIDYANIIIFPLENFEKLLIWDDLKLKQIMGKNLNIKHYCKLEIEIARIIDWLPERIIRIEELLLSKKVNVRKSLGLLKSSSYTLNGLIKNFNIKEDCFEKLIGKVNNLREDWFDLNPQIQENKIEMLLIETKQNLLKALDLFDLWLSSNTNYSLADNLDNLELKFPNNSSYLFKKKINKRIIKNSQNKIKLCLSNFYLLHFLCYSTQNGIISNKLKNSFNIDISDIKIEKIPETYFKLLKERINLCNYWALFLRKNNFENGLFKMGWFYNN